MDESLTDEERAALKASAIRSLRDQEAKLARSHEIHTDQVAQSGQNLLRPPIHHTFFVDAVRDLRRAGVDVTDWYLRPPHLIDWKQGKRGKRMQMIDATGLLFDIRRVLAEVDPMD